jgi:SPP1 family predicted phage head-tail adaptor
MAKFLKDKKIRLYKTSYKQDAIGNQVESLDLVGSLWAYFREIGGSEYYTAATAQVEGEEVVFHVNWRDDYDNTMVIAYRGKVYSITRVDSFEGYKEDIKLYCKLDPRVTVPEY